MKNPDTYYHSSIKPIYNTKRPRLDNNKHAQICIIGAGFSGISSALHLAKAGYEVIVLEKNTVGWGASGRNGGQVSTGQRCSVQKLENTFGRKKAQKLWTIGFNASQLVKNIIDEHHIQCDYQKGIYYTAWKKNHLPELHEEADMLKKHYNFTDVETLGQADIRHCIATDHYYGGIYDKAAAHLHPLNYVLGMAKAAEALGVKIYENTEILRWDKRWDKNTPLSVQAQHATITCENLIFCCNGYLDHLMPYAAKKILPINNFVIATETLTQSEADTLIKNNAAVCDSKFIVEYYRLTASRRLLFGGGESYSRNLPTSEKIQKIVHPLMLRVFPQLHNKKIDFRWGGTLAITRTRMPSFAQYEKNIYYIQGYSGAGVAMATMAGKLLADTISGNKEVFDLMCETAPSSFPGGRYIRWPITLAGLYYHALLDRL